MIEISPELKSAFNPNNGEGGRFIDFAVSWYVGNVEVQKNSVVTAYNQEESISRPAQITNGDGDALNFATFEPNGFPLGGSIYVPPRVYEMPGTEVGIVFSEISDKNGYYSTPQVVTITMPYKYEWLGFTVSFGAVPAADFSISYFEDDALLHSTEIIGNTASLYADDNGAMTSCNKVVISITRSSIPFRRARISEALFGIIRQYDKTNSKDLQITESTDFLRERIPSSELKISVSNFAGEFNIFDPSGIYKFLQLSQKLSVKVGAMLDDGEILFCSMGSFYLTKPEMKNNFTQLSLTACGTIGLLQDSTYNKGVFKTATLAQFADEIAADANVSVRFPDYFSNILLSGYIPSVSHAEALRRIAQAGGTFIKANREDIIVFSEYSDGIIQTLTKNDYRNGNGITPSDDKIINTIEVEYVSIEVDTAVQKLAEVSGSGVHTIKYSESAEQSISITNGEIISVEFYCDNAIIEISSGTAVISGKALKPTKSLVYADNKYANEATLLYSVKGNPLIQAANAADIAENYLKLKANNRRTVKVNYRGYPYLEIGDCINFDTDAHLTQGFSITKSTLKLSGGMTGTLETREAIS